MNKQDKGYGYLQSTEISIFYPLFLSKKRYEELVKLLSVDLNFSKYKFFKKNNSPFLPYIENINQVYRDKKDSEHKEYKPFYNHGMYSFELNHDAMPIYLESLSSCTTIENYQLVNKDESTHRNLHIRASSTKILVYKDKPVCDFLPPMIHLFSSNIVLFHVKVVTTQQISSEKYYGLSRAINGFFESISPKHIIAESIENEKAKKLFENVVLLDDSIKKRDDQKAKSTSRFQLFVDIKLKQDIVTADKDLETIAQYFTFPMSTRELKALSIGDEKSSKPKIHRMTHMFEGNRVYVSPSAIVSITNQNEDNRQLIAKFDNTMDNFKTPMTTNKTFIYLLILHQYYFLHKIAEDIRGVSKRKNYIKQLRQIMLEYSIYKSDFDFYYISSQKQYQNFHRVIYDEFMISEFSKEVQDSTIPIESSYKIAADQANDFVIKMFGLATVFNVFYILSKENIILKDEENLSFSITLAIDKLHHLLLPVLVTVILFLLVLTRRRRSTNIY